MEGRRVEKGNGGEGGGGGERGEKEKKKRKMRRRKRMMGRRRRTSCDITRDIWNFSRYCKTFSYVSDDFWRNCERRSACEAMA